jgi:hypothetical protein
VPAFLARQYIPGLDIMVDPCAAVLVFIVTALLCAGIKEVNIYLVLILFYCSYGLKCSKHISSHLISIFFVIFNLNT